MGPKHTVLTLNTHTALSHSVPALGLKPSSFDNDLASLSTRSRNSTIEYSAPESPHVKGALERFIGCRPYCSSSIKSQTGMESGGSKGSFGTHDGEVKTILANSLESEAGGNFEWTYTAK